MGLLAALGMCLVVYPIAVLLAVALVAAHRRPKPPDLKRPEDSAIKTPDLCNAPQARKEFMSFTLEELCAMYEDEDEEL